MKWLITGGCGFIGSNLANTVLSKGEEVIILDNLSRSGAEQNLAWLQQRYGTSWAFIQEDVRHRRTTDSVLKKYKPDVIAHLAGQVAMTTSLKNPRVDFVTNAWGTLNILEAIRSYSPKTILLYSSTNKVYGSLENLRIDELENRYILPDFPDGLDETLPLDGYSPYGCSKLAAEQYVRDYARVFGLQTVVFRHSSMYGGRQYATFDQGWIGWFCQKALEMVNPTAPPFTISGNGKQVRDLLYADDLVNVYLLAVQHIGITAGEIYNIGGGVQNSLSLVELFSMLEHFIGNPIRYSRLDWRPGDQKVFIADSSKAKTHFGWAPETNKEAGIQKMLTWCMESQRA